MGWKQLADVSGPAEQHRDTLWDVHLGQTLCDAKHLSQLPEKVQGFLSFVFGLVSIQGFGRETSIAQRWVRGGSLQTHPSTSLSYLSTFERQIYWSPTIKGPVLSSILPFCTNKKLLLQFYLTPTFPESRVNWKLGQTEEENRTGTNWHPRHGSAFSTRRAMTHRRRRRASTPVSCLKPVLLLCPFQHFPVPVCWF